MVFDYKEGGWWGMTVSQGKVEGRGWTGQEGGGGGGGAAAGRSFSSSGGETMSQALSDTQLRGRSWGGDGGNREDWEGAEEWGSVCSITLDFLFVFLAIEQPIGSKDDEDTEQKLHFYDSSYCEQHKYHDENGNS